jgi:3-hydroxy acid dehydrogenase/malonic semialdehyde reductase
VGQETRKYILTLLSPHSGLVKGLDQAPNIKPADISTMFDTNVTGLINMTQAILPILKARPDNGRGDIINIGSIAGREAYQGGSIYCATKAAVRSFTDSLRRELISSRIRVIEIDPGQVETEFSVVRFYGDAEKAKKVYEGVEPLTPDDIAEVVVFAAGRRENVVIADTLVFPSHQVCFLFSSNPGLRYLIVRHGADSWRRRRRRLCIGSRSQDCGGTGTGTGIGIGIGLTNINIGWCGRCCV